MNIIFKSQSKRLIKGNSYEVECLFNSGTGTRSWMNGKVKLKNISGFFSVNSFTDTNGKELPKIDWGSLTVKTWTSLKFEDLKVGDILICTSDNYKTLLNGGYYKIEGLSSVKKSQYYNENKIKLTGVSRTLKFNSWCFRKMSTEELRDANLNELLYNKSVPVIKSAISRKFDYIEDKNKALLEIISKSILDTNRHKLSVVDWACLKIGDKLGIKPSDFSEILELSLKDILEQIK